MVIDKTEQQEVLLPTNHKYYSFQWSLKEQKAGENFTKFTESWLCLKLGFLRHSCRCYGDYIEVCDCFISNAVLIVIGIYIYWLFDYGLSNYKLSDYVMGSKLVETAWSFKRIRSSDSRKV